MKWKVLSALVAALSIMASAASADILQGTGSATWQSYPADTQENKQPYWDGNSSDYGTAGNVGNYLTKTGAFALNASSPNLTNPQWWGNVMTPGAADLNMSFQSTGAGHNANILIEVAGFASTNVFGWYKVGSPGLNQLFTGAQSAGASQTFSVPVGTNYGFYIGVGTATYYMDSALNSSVSKKQHFAIFRASNATDLLNFPNSFFIGVEDLNLGDADYQDMIVKLTPGQVPLPPSAFLLGSGLLGLLGLKWRRRNGKS